MLPELDGNCEVFFTRCKYVYIYICVCVCIYICIYIYMSTLLCESDIGIWDRRNFVMQLP